MRNFFQNWSYPKHAATVTCFYLGGAILVNTLFGKKVPKDEKSLKPTVVCKQMTKRQWIFNGILAAGYTFDMTATFAIIKKIRKKLA